MGVSLRLPFELLMSKTVDEARAAVRQGSFFQQLLRQGMLRQLLRVGVPPVIAVDFCFLAYPSPEHGFAFPPRPFDREDELELSELESESVLFDVKARGLRTCARGYLQDVGSGRLPWEAVLVGFFRDTP